MKNSVQFKRRLNHFLTYLYLVVLSIVIIYPLLITVLSAFKTGNVSAFTLDFSGSLSFDNFQKLFTDTLYGTWYLNTLIIAIITMVAQTSIITLAGYAYSRYNFLARKQSLVFFLIIQMVPTMAACFDCLLRYGLDVERLEPQLVPDLPLCRWRNSNECLVDEGLLRYSPNFT